MGKPLVAGGDPAADFVARWVPVIDEALSRGIVEETGAGHLLKDPAEYLFVNRGKMIRPLAVLAACELVGGRADKAVEGACAIEWIHVASLILDDLPCMDDARRRRGVAPLHRAFGEATAVLTALLLLNLSHRRLATLPSSEASAWHARICDLLGGQGMILGQAVDVRFRGNFTSPASADLVDVRLRKTTSLMIGALELGGRLGAADPVTVEGLGRLGLRIGRLLQAADDQIDGDVVTPEGHGDPHRTTGTNREHRSALRLLHRTFPDDTSERWVMESLIRTVADHATASGHALP